MNDHTLAIGRMRHTSNIASAKLMAHCSAADQVRRISPAVMAPWWDTLKVLTTEAIEAHDAYVKALLNPDLP